jgi:hypothetical protein
MKKLFLFWVVNCLFQVVYADPPNDNSVVLWLKPGYSSNHVLRLNGREITGARLVDELSAAIKDRWTPLIVLLPNDACFSDWQDIMGVVDKVGFLKCRYFVYSNTTQRMTELSRPRKAVEFSLHPKPLDQTSKDRY